MRSRSAPSLAPRIRTASSPALRAPPTATVATGTPAGIDTMDSSESSPSRCLSGTGTPITGSGVTAASMPGRWAAPPAPAMITRSPRPAAADPYSIISCGIRCADTTSASWGTPNSSSAAAAASITGQSESLPMTTPTRAPPFMGSILSRSQIACRAPGPLSQLVPQRGIPGHGHVPDLAPRAHLLAVQVHLHTRIGRHHMQVAPVHAGIGTTKDIRHNDLRRDRTGSAQRKVQDGPQVLLELRCRGPLDGPVPAVVRPHGQLVDQQQPLAARFEQLHREQPGHVQLGGELEREPLGLARLADRQPRRGRQHLVADPVALDGLHDRVDDALAVRRPGGQHGQLPVEVDVLLREHRDAMAEHLRRLVRRLAYPYPAPVVAAADRLEHHRPAGPGGEFRDP